jgi:asparagine synthase (glutamine-hydrolysing)
MCGITGVVQFENQSVDPGVLRRMTDAMVHRGPDGEGIFLDGAIGLGHRRLSIIDLSDAAAQPMQSQNGRFTISYNGEVYNFRELRRELESIGHRFVSHSDTEVVLHAFTQWGADAIDRLNGMFALAIWDQREQRLFLARDRYGIKPLYYFASDQVIAFASEIKSLLEHPQISARMDREGLLEYLTFQNFFTNRTLFEGVRTFPAGHWATIDMHREHPRLEFHEYWDYKFDEPAVALDEQEYLTELDRLFRQAVSRQLVSDVEIGCYLSGGIDSGAITSIAAKAFPNLKSFTCGFDLSSASGLELAYDERVLSEMMSYHFQTEHYEMVLKAGDMQRSLPALTTHLEEPRVGQSYPNFYVARLASKFVKVVLSGTGGDELFGGYPWRYYRAVVNDNFEDYIDKYYLFWQRLINNKTLKRMTAPIGADLQHVMTRDIFRNVFPESSDAVLHTPEEYVNHSLYFEAKTFLHGLLVVEDKLSMAHSLETRVPFLDNDLVDFAMQVPVNLKLANLQDVVRLNENETAKFQKHFQRTRDGKILLRKMLSPLVPPEVATGIKQGFSAPDASWFKGDSLEFVKNRLLTPHARIYEFLDYSTCAEIINEHLQGIQNRRLLIWSLLNLDQWCHRFL